MKTKKHAYRLIGAVCALAAVACVDESFDLSNVSTDITLGSDKTTVLPLGYLEEKSLGDLMSDQEIEGLEKDENGNYAVHFKGEMNNLDVDGIDDINHVVKIPAMSSSFEADYPAFELADLGDSIDEYCDIATMLYGQEILINQPIDVPAGIYIKGKEESSIEYDVVYKVPKEIADIKRLYFKPTNEGEPGARIDMRFLLNDLSAINGGGHVTLELKAPKGFHLYDGNGDPVEDGNFAISEYDFKAGENELQFVAFVESVELDNAVQNGELTINADLEYHLSFEMTTTKGSITYKNSPQLHLVSDYAYADADIILNEVALIDNLQSDGGNLVINDLPKEIVSINSLTFVENSPIVLRASGLEWMADELTEQVVIDAWLPDYIVLHENQEIGYNAQEHKLHTTLKTLLDGIEVDLDAIDFGDEGLSPKDGNIKISFAPKMNARVDAGTEIKLSSIMHEGKININAGIEATELDIDSVSGKIQYEYNYEKRIDLKELGNLVINGTGLTPVLKITLENPFTFEATASYNVVPYIDGEVQADRAINTNGYNGVGYVTIPAATVEEGVVKPTSVTLILGTEDSKGDYTSDEYIFIPCDIEKLLSGEFPDELDINVWISTNPFEKITIYTADEYKLKCSYEFDMPIVISGDMGIHYSGSLNFDNIEGGNPFDSLAEIEGIKMGDVAIIANVTTTLPVDLTARADFLDSEGEVLENLVVVHEDYNTIHGSEDGTTPNESVVRLDINLDGDGDIRQLADIGAIRIKLDANAATEESAVALHEDQYVSIKLQLELTGGITIDLKTLQN